MTGTSVRDRRGLLARGLHWPLLVVLVFVGNMAVAATILVIANSDPSFAVEPDYYDKALGYEREVEQRRRNLELGWSLSLPDLVRTADDGVCELLVEVADRGGAPIDGATVTMTAFPIARAGDRAEVSFDAVGAGRYAARLTHPRPGLWELRLRVERAGEVFTQRTGAEVRGAR